MYYNAIKRLLDFIVALVMLLITSPLMLFIFIVLGLSGSNGPFFLQSRPGKNEKLFKIIKFRTMSNKTNINGELLPDSKRLTNVGRFIRKTSLDELPQLFNILLGEMSFVGPRPLLSDYLPYYTEAERIRHKIRPGITGYAQTNGRNKLDWNVRLELDVYYVNNMNFLMDFKILVQTVSSVLRAKDIVIDPGSELENLDKLRSKKI